MEKFEETIRRLQRESISILEDSQLSSSSAMPGQAFFMKDGSVLMLPRDEGDSRYPYGQNGFNFWAYSSGYMHANEGLFSVFLRAAEGQEPRVAFFAGRPSGNGAYSPLPILQVPVSAGYPSEQTFDRMTIFASSSAYYLARCQDLFFALRVMVNAGKEICFSLHMENTSGQSQAFFTSMFMNPFLRHQIYESGEDRWFKEIRVANHSSHGLSPFLVSVNEDKDRFTSVSNYAVIRRSLTGSVQLVRAEETTSRFQFVGGSKGSLHAPASLRNGTFGHPASVCTFVDNAIAGDLLHLELKPGASARYDAVVSMIEEGMAGAERKMSTPLTPNAIDTELAQLEKSNVSVHSGMTVKVGDSVEAQIEPNVFNHFFEHLKKQVEFCSLLKGYVQLSENSLIGIRDVFQALEGLVFWNPVPARAKMLEALGYTAPDGRCFRQYSLRQDSPLQNGKPFRQVILGQAGVLESIADALPAKRHAG